jgi:hypothetical protein
VFFFRAPVAAGRLANTLGDMNNEHFTLRGAEPGQLIEFVAIPEISDHSFDIAVSFAGYRLAETSVTLFVGPFLQDLASFERSRVGTAKLTGTYDFEFEVAAFESRGDALVSFSMNRPGFSGELRV